MVSNSVALKIFIPRLNAYTNRLCSNQIFEYQYGIWRQSTDIKQKKRTEITNIDILGSWLELEKDFRLRIKF